MTRPEWAVMAGLAMMVGSVVFCTAWAFHLRSTRNMVVSDLREVERACEAFRKIYDKYPTRFDVFYDYRYGLKNDVSNNEVMNVLLAVDGPGNEGHSINTNQTAFIQIEPAGFRFSGLNQRGEFVDPWGTPYQLVLDMDLNKTCDLFQTIYDRAIGKGVAVWSCGPDGVENTSDDILGWKQKEKEKEIEVTGSEESAEN